MYRAKPLAATLLGLALLVWNPAVPALSGDARQPIELEADSVDIDEGKGVSVYQGHVSLRQGSIRLEADTVTVTFQGRRPQQVVAVGRPVRFQQQPDGDKEPVKGSARRAEYLVDSEELVLIGDAHLKQGRDSFNSDRIVYDRVQAKIKAGAAAQGKERVKITIGSQRDTGK